MAHQIQPVVVILAMKMWEWFDANRFVGMGNFMRIYVMTGEP